MHLRLSLCWSAEEEEEPGQAALSKCEMLAACIAAVLASCSSPSTGSQTGGEGLCSPCGCPSDLQEISVGARAELGFPVDRDLAFVRRGTAGDVSPKRPRVRRCWRSSLLQGSIVFRAELQSLSNMKSNPKCRRAIARLSPSRLTTVRSRPVVLKPKVFPKEPTSPPI